MQTETTIDPVLESALSAAREKRRSKVIAQRGSDEKKLLSILEEADLPTDFAVDDESGYFGCTWHGYAIVRDPNYDTMFDITGPGIAGRDYFNSSEMLFDILGKVAMKKAGE